MHGTQPVEDADLVREAIAADDELRAALHERDMEVVHRRYAPEFMLNSPARNIQGRDESIELLARTSGRQIDYERTIEAAYPSGDDIVVIRRHRRDHGTRGAYMGGNRH